MGYTPVKTVTEGMPWTAKDMNTYLRDNFAAGVPDLFTTKGDIAAASGSDAAVRVGAGPNNSWLFADSGATGGVKQALPNRVSVTPSGSIGSTVVNEWAQFTSWDTEVFDPAAAFASDRFTCQHAGMYVIIVACGGDGLLVAPDAYTSVRLGVYKNGTLYQVVAADYSNKSAVDQSYKWFCNGITLVKLAAGDYLEIYYYISESAGAISLYSSSNIDYWMVHFLA